MLKFLRANLDPQNPKNKAMAEARRKHFEGMGLGWHLREYAWHNGQTGGYHSFLALDPRGLPTLIWQWNLGGEPATEYHLYFAWKDTP